MSLGIFIILMKMAQQKKKEGKNGPEPDSRRRAPLHD
jgi:hypothetical protein